MEPKPKPVPGVDFWTIEKTPLALMNYATGAKAKLRPQRQETLRKAVGADFRKWFSEEDYVASRAAEWGDPGSPDRIHAIVRCVAFPIHGWTSGSKRAMDDAVRHRVEDLEFVRSKHFTSEETWPWDYDRWSHLLNDQPPPRRISLPGTGAP